MTQPKELCWLKIEKPTGAGLLEQLRERLAAAGFGVTAQGAYLTIRYSDGRGNLVTVSTIVTSITRSDLVEREGVPK